MRYHKLIELTSRRNAEVINEEISKLEHGDGDVDMASFWKLKRKLFPKTKDVYEAKVDSKGHLVSSRGKIKRLYLETYQERLKHRNIKEG